MPGHWTRATRLVRCTSFACERTLVRDEPVYLVAGVENQPTCPRCAERRFKRTPPDNLPHLAPIAEKVQVAPLAAALPLSSDSHERPGAFQQFNHAFFTGETRDAIKKVRAQQRRADAVDPKLKQLGADR